MKTTAIICEYNPMTNGHAYHIKKAREETGADTVLCVMSGSFTQRGDAALADKYLRAEVAVYNGADIVVELPTIYAVSPADNFAYGAVKTISAFPNVEYLSFGSECGDAALIEKIAQIMSCEPEDYKALIQKHLKDGNSFPKARAMAFNEYASGKEELKDAVGALDAPNNVLGVAYATAIIKAGLPIKLHTIKRVGADYNSADADCEFPSSSAMREAMRKGEFDKIKKGVPDESYWLMKNHNSNGTSLGDMTLFRIKNMSGYDIEKLYDISGGIHNRIKIASQDVNNIDALLENAKTKKYTMARLKRICLYALFDITQEKYDECVNCPPYIQILAMRKDRRNDVLSELSANCKNVLTRFSDVSKVDKSLRYMVKLDFTAQGTLEIINRSNYYNKKMLLVEFVDI